MAPGTVNDNAVQSRCGIWILIAAILAVGGDCMHTSHDLLPLPCDSVKCPSMTEISCPEDSYIRELTNLEPLMYTNSSNLSSPSTNATEIPEELYTQCCVAAKCVCKTCDIPTCHNTSQVIYETVPESQMPGKCCGEYECRAEPDCSEVRDTDGHWLYDCQRCKCLYGERICHRSCDEVMKNPEPVFCKSKVLNRFFSHGEGWKEGCSECECHYGERKCMMPFCRSVNCLKSEQVILQGSCCPVCWPQTDNHHHQHPHHDDNEDDDVPSSADYEDNIGTDDADELANYDGMEEHHEGEEDLLPDHQFDATNLVNSTENEILPAPSVLHIAVAVNVNTTSTTTTPTLTPTPIPSSTRPATTTTSTASPVKQPAPPCMVNRQDPSATYAVYPEVVEVVRPANNIDVLYAIIGCLSVAVVVLCAIVCQMRAKQRSYRPVSNLDDNFNKTASSNIKKMNDYV